jgi:hypothetical protein
MELMSVGSKEDIVEIVKKQLWDYHYTFPTLRGVSIRFLDKY